MKQSIYYLINIIKRATFITGNRDKNSIAISTQQITTAIKHPSSETNNPQAQIYFQRNECQLLQI